MNQTSLQLTDQDTIEVVGGIGTVMAVVRCDRFPAAQALPRVWRDAHLLLAWAMAHVDAPVLAPITDLKRITS